MTDPETMRERIAREIEPAAFLHPERWGASADSLDAMAREWAFARADAILDVLAEPNKGMRLASKRYKAATKVPTGPGVWRAMIEAIRSGA